MFAERKRYSNNRTDDFLHISVSIHLSVVHLTVQGQEKVIQLYTHRSVGCYYSPLFYLFTFVSVLFLCPSYAVFIDRYCRRNNAQNFHFMHVADKSNRVVPNGILDNCPLLFVSRAYARGLCTFVLPKYHIVNYRLRDTKVT